MWNKREDHKKYKKCKKRVNELVDPAPQYLRGLSLVYKGIKEPQVLERPVVRPPS